MNDIEINILDRFDTPSGVMFTVRDKNDYRIGQTIRYRGTHYTITGINVSKSLNVVGLTVRKI